MTVIVAPGITSFRLSSPVQLLLFQVVATALVNASYALIVGALAASLWLGKTDDINHAGVHANLAFVIGTGFVSSIIATLLSLWQASAIMADVPLLQSGPSLWAMFAGTSYGQIGLVSVGMLAMGAAVHFLLRQRLQLGAYYAAILCILGLFALCRVATGHASENGLVSVAAAVELVHLLSIALWLGSVLVAAWVVLPKFANQKTAAPMPSYLAALSGWATVALAGVLTTGLYNAFRVLNAPTELVSTEYGWVLTTKLCFVGIAIALGGWNRFVGFPQTLRGSQAPADEMLRSITVVLRVESIALLIVMLAASVLTASAPPTAT